MRQYPLYIDGKETAAKEGRWLDTCDPATGQPWARIARGGPEDVEAAVAAAHRAFGSAQWAGLSASGRGMLLHRLGDLIAREARALAETEVRDNGKLMAEMHAQLQYVPQWFYYYAGLADKVEGTVIPTDKAGFFNFTRNEPLGVVAAITPWNSPLLLTAWKIAPALAAGCTVVIKPSEFASVSTLEFVRLFKEAGFPDGVVNVVTGLGAEVGAALVAHPGVSKVTFTGSDETGRHIGAAATGQLKHVSLELGGKSPNVVFEDADLPAAVNGCISGIFAATGQTCIAGSRVLVQSSVHDEFVERLLALARTARVGHPADAATQVGPVTTRQQLDKILHYIEVAKAEGARLMLGGERLAATGAAQDGWFVQPTVFTGVKNSMRIAQEEVFGPVLSVIRFDTEDEAVRIANDVRFGLAAGIWTQDMGRAFRVSAQIQAGTVWVNSYRAVSYMSPFGGYKDSGLGRENGIGAIREYLQTKSVWMNIGAPAGNPFVIR
ncbi:aldehyde dehydrogenase [Cupriavidus sp. 30B13]|uniref:aldehyde dehydrogenase n=1 Tax=Cupriavidus sp. 30B13 TaxID=3384241 RepID=UPI003B8F5D43